MDKRRLGNTGWEVHAIGLGAMPLSIAGRPNQAEALSTIWAAIEAGMDFIDTADVYCLDDDDIGHNERLIAAALRERPNARVRIATKGGLERPKGAWTCNGRPEHLKKACERSLVALGVDTIELYQLHAPDDRVPFADSVGALVDLKQAGKIRHIGLSNVDVEEIEIARKLCDIASVQNRLNPFETDSFENGVVAHCEKHGIAFLPHSPVGGHRSHARVTTDRALGRVAATHGRSPYEVCLAFLLALSPAMLPIPGASRPASAQSSARAANLVLTSDDMAALRAAFPRARV